MIWRQFLPYAMLAALLLGAPMLGSPYVVSLMTRAAILACAAVSLQFIVGTTGLISLGQAAFLGIGAYTLLALQTLGDDEATFSLPAAMVAAGLFALITGWFALRTSGVTFIMITLAFGQMAYFVAQSLAMFGGDDGMALDQRPALFGRPWLQGRLFWHMLVVGLLTVLLILFQMLEASRFGRALRAARENASRAAASGFNVYATRWTAYAVSGAAGGAAGWLLAVQSGFVSPAMLEWRNSGELLMIVILGGVTTASGAALAAVVLVLAQEGLAMLTEHWRLILGLVLVLIVVGKAIRVRRV